MIAPTFVPRCMRCAMIRIPGISNCCKGQTVRFAVALAIGVFFSISRESATLSS
jgi:hypothetical protein